VDKMKFSLKTLMWTYGIETRRIVQSVPGNIILTSHPIAFIFLL
jgi:hypothetical protein